MDESARLVGGAGANIATFAPRASGRRPSRVLETDSTFDFGLQTRKDRVFPVVVSYRRTADEHQKASSRSRSCANNHEQRSPRSRRQRITTTTTTLRPEKFDAKRASKKGARDKLRSVGSLGQPDGNANNNQHRPDKAAIMVLAS